ncbi:penicillin-binding protein [Salmonella enterica subsp. enterica serovar Typhimurium]|nr:penicillin-binding protein [Salmonella enterica subsp. enterica serovar Typhimurium]
MSGLTCLAPGGRDRDAVRQILRQQAGIDIGNTIIADGSGLSRHNLIAPATMMQVLQYIAQHDNELNFISMLPLAGYDGSLQYRAGLHQAGVDGKVSAKTGSLQGVYNLAGLLPPQAGTDGICTIFVRLRGSTCRSA